MRIISKVKWIPLIALAMTGCEFAPQLITDSKTSAKASTPFTNNWAFNATDTASYSYNSSTMDFTGGVCRLTSSDQQDVTSSNFASAALTGAAWDGANNLVRLGAGSGCDGTAKDCAVDLPKWQKLVGYWKLNEPNGTVGAATIYDYSGSGNHGAPNGTLNLGTASMFGTSPNFDGSTGYVSIPDSPSLKITGTFTVSAWIKLSATADYYMILTKEPASVATVNYELRVYGTHLEAYATVGGVLCGGSGPSNLTSGTWTHVAMVYDGSTITEYVNGASVASWACSGAVTTTTDTAYIGRRGDGHYFPGQIDEVALWNTSLTAAEINGIYARKSAPKFSGSIASRVFDAFSAGASWTTFSWIPTLPFFKELPDYSGGAIQNETSANYSSLVGMNGNVGDNNLMNGIVALWHFDEAAGPMADSSGNGNTANIATGAVMGVPGRFGNAVKFSGTNDVVTSALSNNVGLSGNIGSFSSWFYTYGDIGNAYQNILVAYNAGHNQFPYQIFLEAGTLNINWYSDANGAIISSGVPVTPNRWNHVVVTVNGPTGKFYLNGVLVGTTGIQIAGTTNPMYVDIGNYVNLGNRQMNGMIDEVAIWNRVLHPNEVLQLYRRGANRIKFQVRSCSSANCTDDPTGIKWKGPDGTNLTYFSEFHNKSTQSANPTGTVNKSLPSMLFSNFTTPPGTNQYFQYRTILESDDSSTACYGGSACSPELKSVKVDPVHYDASAPTVYGKTGVAFTSLNNFIQTLGASGCTNGVVYNLSRDKTNWYYWNGASWVISNNTSAQANTAAQIAANAAGFGSQIGTGTVYFKAYLKSSGTTACELDNVEIDGLQ